MRISKSRMAMHNEAVSMLKKDALTEDERDFIFKIGMRPLSTILHMQGLYIEFKNTIMGVEIAECDFSERRLVTGDLFAANSYTN